MDPELISELPEREAYLKSVLDYHAKVESNLTAVLEQLQWNSQHFLSKESVTATCKYCPDHKMPVDSLKKHEDVCQWIQQGYTKEELENEIPSSEFFYEKSKIIPIKLEKDLLNRILNEHHRQMKTAAPYTDRNVPQTMVASKVYFTQAERLAVYEYVVQRSKELNCMQSMPDDNLLTIDFEDLIKKSAKSKVENVLCSEVEKWAAMRDYKRRRQSYRAKNVHITKKTYTEIIREVIHNQVDLLQEGLKSEPGNGDKSGALPEGSLSPSSSQKNRMDSERKAKKHSESDHSRYKSRSYPRKKSRESPDRRHRGADKRSLKSSDPQSSLDKYQRDHASPDVRKRDHRSMESHDRRGRGSPDRWKRSRRSPQLTRDKDRRSPQSRKHDKGSRKSGNEEQPEGWKNQSRNNPEGLSLEKRSKQSEDQMQLLLMSQPPPPSSSSPSVIADEALLAKERQETESRFPMPNKALKEDQEAFGKKSLPNPKAKTSSPDVSRKRTSSSSDDDDGSSVSHRRRKHSKSKKHKKHKHKSEKKKN